MAVPVRQVRMKGRVYEILEVGQDGDRVSLFVDWALMLLILANVAAIIAATDPKVHDLAEVHFRYFELVSYCIFAVEYILRVWSMHLGPEIRPPAEGTPELHLSAAHARGCRRRPLVLHYPLPAHRPGSGCPEDVAAA